MGDMTGRGFPPTALTPWLFVGRAEDTGNDAWMQAHNVQYIVNCLGPASAPPEAVRRRLARRHGYISLSSKDVLNYPLFAAKQPDGEGLTNWQRTCLVFDAARAAHAAHRTAAPAPTAFVYCAAGLNRSATLAAAYVALCDHAPGGLMAVAAVLKKARPGALSNPSFVRQLISVALGIVPGAAVTSSSPSQKMQAGGRVARSPKPQAGGPAAPQRCDGPQKNRRAQ